MIDNRTQNVKQKSPQQWLSVVLAVVSISLILFGALGIVALQDTLTSTSQDLRGDASVANGEVELSFSPGNQGTFQRDQDQKIDISLNTKNQNITDVELVFNVISESVYDLTLRAYSDSNLQVTNQEIEATSDGFLVSFKVKAPNGTSFTTSSARKIASLEFKPTTTGELKLSFDAEKSVAYKANTSPKQDTLRTIATQTYSIVGESGDKNCNESCTSNSSCDSNHRCFEGRCRLATNPSSTSCVNPPDQGLQRTCNEYCADTRECSTGFSCYFNRCRRPDNVESTTCAAPTVATTQTTIQTCNKSCTSNSQCAVNMRCFDGACRLASNPSSTSCSAVTDKKVSETYYPAASPTATPIPKGANLGGTATNSGTATASGTISPSTTPFPIFTPAASAAPQPNSDRLPAMPSVETNSGIIDGIMGSIRGLMTRFGTSLPIIALIIGVLLLLAVIVMFILNFFRRRPPTAPSAAQTPAASKTQSELQQKIDQLRQDAASGTPPAPQSASVTKQEASTPPPSTLQFNKPATQSNSYRPPVSPPSQPAQPPRAPFQTPPNTPTAVNRPPATPMPPQAAQPVRATQPTPTPQSRPPATSMLDRMKQKGVSVPQQKDGV
ncbi:MAG: hypothetical protein M3Q81_00270 [bacterium]|nr:hypothetical protein [bacterium]